VQPLDEMLDLDRALGQLVVGEGMALLPCADLGQPLGAGRRLIRVTTGGQLDEEMLED